MTKAAIREANERFKLHDVLERKPAVTAAIASLPADGAFTAKSSGPSLTHK